MGSIWHSSIFIDVTETHFKALPSSYDLKDIAGRENP